MDVFDVFVRFSLMLGIEGGIPSKVSHSNVVVRTGVFQWVFGGESAPRLSTQFG